MDKLQLTGQNLDGVFNLKCGQAHAVHLCCCEVKLPNLKMKTRPTQLLGSLPIDIALPVLFDWKPDGVWDVSNADGVQVLVLARLLDENLDIQGYDLVPI